jgi:hypothetical protein
MSQEATDGLYLFAPAEVDGAPFDMSFSGLKTAVVNLNHNMTQMGETPDLPGLCASFAGAVSDMLVPRAMEALSLLGYDTLVAAGGVAANSRIRSDLTAAACGKSAKLFLPPLSLCGDNRGDDSVRRATSSNKARAHGVTCPLNRPCRAGRFFGLEALKSPPASGFTVSPERPDPLFAA